jgi:hypothetical protein
VWRSRVFERIEARDIFCQDEPVFNDVVVGEHGIILKIALLDHEHGSPESVRKEVQKQADRVANTITGAVKALTGVNIDDAISEGTLEDNILDTLGDISLDLLTNALSDDKIDEKQWQIPAKTLRDWVDNRTLGNSAVVYPPRELPAYIKTNYPYEGIFDGTRLFSGGGGSYKVYLRIIPQRVERRYD